ncbi:MAG: flavodoxin family protein [Eubacteriales bacterium]
MKNAIVYSSASGNTEKLAEAIKNKVGDVIYCGKVDDAALEADVIYVGFWAMKFTCGPDIQGFLEKLQGKKIFLFGTAGYDDTEEYFKSILDAAKGNIPASNTVIGEYMCMGKVSEAKQKSIKEMDEAKFNGMKAKLDKAESHPNQDDLTKLTSLI